MYVICMYASISSPPPCVLDHSVCAPLCVCMYVFMHACMNYVICMYVTLCVNRSFLSMPAHLLHTYIHICIHTNRHRCLHAHTCLTHTYIHTYIHTYKHVDTISTIHLQFTHTFRPKTKRKIWVFSVSMNAYTSKYLSDLTKELSKCFSVRIPRSITRA